MGVRGQQALAMVATACLAFFGTGGATGAHGAKSLRVGFVLEPAGAEDAYGRIAFAGFRRAVRDFHVEGRALTPGVREGNLPSFAYFARQGYDLVLGLGIIQANDIDLAARTFPGTKFAILDTAWELLPHRPKNVRGTDYKVEEGAYLAGYLATLMEGLRPGRDVVSSVGGFKVPTVDDFVAGYQAGARKAKPRVKTLNAYANDWLDQEKCRRVALAQIAKGSGVVFQVAGACGLGALAAAKEKGVFGIGVDADQSSLGPHILTSVVKRMDVAAYETIRSLVEGRFRTGRTVVFDLRNGGVGLGRISPKVPRRLVTRVERIRRQIVSGRIRDIPTTVP